MQWVRLLHQRSSRKKGYWMILKKKKKSFCNAETGLEELVSRHPFWCRDLAEGRTEFG